MSCREVFRGWVPRDESDEVPVLEAFKIYGEVDINPIRSVSVPVRGIGNLIWGLKGGKD